MIAHKPNSSDQKIKNHRHIIINKNRILQKDKLTVIVEDVELKETFEPKLEPEPVEEVIAQIEYLPVELELVKIEPVEPEDNFDLEKELEKNKDLKRIYDKIIERANSNKIRHESLNHK